METQETLHQAAALRHSFHANHRLRLEFLGNLSKLLRDYGIETSDELLGSLVLSVPEEILTEHQNGNGNGHQLAQATSDYRAAVPPSSPGRTSPPPVSPDRTAHPPDSPDRAAVPPKSPSAVPPKSPSAVPPRSPSALPPKSPA